MTYSLQTKTNKAGVDIFCVVIRYKDATGEWQQKWKSTGMEVKNNKKRADAFAKQYMEAFEKELAAKAITNLNAENVSADVDFLQYFEYCLEGPIKNKVEPNTYDGYKSHYSTQIKPYFALKGLLLSQVTRKHLQAFYDKMLQYGRIDGKGGLSIKSVRRFKVLINRVFNIACGDDEILMLNPNTNCRLEKNEEKPYEAPFYTEEQVERLLSHIPENDPFYAMVVFGAYYGLRRSEVLGLKWDAINLKENKIHIKHKVVGGKQEYRRDKTKNKSSKRELPLFLEAKKMLIAMKFEQNKNRKLYGDCYKDTEDYIFVREDGTKIHSDYPTKRMERIVKQKNLPRMTFHGLRHSCASILINKGFTLHKVSKFLGHSSVAMTGNVYGHLFDDGKNDMAEAMNVLMEKAKSKRSLENSLELAKYG